MYFLSARGKWDGAGYERDSVSLWVIFRPILCLLFSEAQARWLQIFKCRNRQKKNKSRLKKKQEMVQLQTEIWSWYTLSNFHGKHPPQHWSVLPTRLPTTFWLLPFFLLEHLTEESLFSTLESNNHQYLFSSSTLFPKICMKV